MKTALNNEQLHYFSSFSFEGLSVELFNQQNREELTDLATNLSPDEQEILIGEEFTPVLRCNLRSNERFTLIGINTNNGYKNPLNN